MLRRWNQRDRESTEVRVASGRDSADPGRAACRPQGLRRASVVWLPAGWVRAPSTEADRGDFVDL